MKNMNKVLSIVISGCIADEQEITVCFQLREGIEAADMQPATFKICGNDRRMYDFFRNFPVFTKEGRLDYGCLEGSRAYLNLIDRGEGWEISSAEFDYRYYGFEPEEEQADFHGETYGG